MRNLDQHENQVEIKKKPKKKSKEMPSLTEEEWLHNEPENIGRKRQRKEKEGNSRPQNIVQKHFIFS